MKYLIAGLLLSFAFFAVACSKNNSPGSDTTTIASDMTGGQDGGGGHTLQSTEAEVNAAIDRALKLARDPDYRFNLFTLWQWDRLFWVHTASTEESLEIFNNGCRVVGGKEAESECRKFTGRPKDDPKFGTGIREIRPFMTKNYFGAILDQSEIKRIQGDCGTAKDDHAHASVSRFEIGAEICLSINHLRRLPPSSLLREVLGLLFHEAAHLNGFAEKEAHLLQSAFVEFYIQRFSSLTKDRYHTAMNHVLSDLHLAAEMMKPENYNQKMGRLFAALESMPLMTDPLGIQQTLGLESPRPALILSYSVMNLYIKYWDLYEDEEPKSKREIEKISQTLQKEISQIIGNYNGFAGTRKFEIRESTYKGPDVKPEYTLVPWPAAKCPATPNLGKLDVNKATDRLRFRMYWGHHIAWILSNEYAHLPKCE